MTIEEYLIKKQQFSTLKKEIEEFSDGLKNNVKSNKGHAVQLEGYEITVQVGQRTGCAGHEKFKEVLGAEGYQTLFEKGLINTSVTEKLGVKKL